MKAVKDTIIVQKVEDDDFSHGVIIHGDRKLKKVIVHAVGDNMDYQINEGDKMYLNRYADAGYGHEIDGVRHYIMRKQDIYGFCNKDNHQEW